MPRRLLNLLSIVLLIATNPSLHAAAESSAAPNPTLIPAPQTPQQRPDWQSRFQTNLDRSRGKHFDLLIGINNIDACTPEQVSEGIHHLLGEYLKRAPHAHLLLLGVFPSLQHPNEIRRAKTTRLNQLIAPLNGEQGRVTFLDFGAKFLSPDGTISPEIMLDFVHPSAKGYEIWAQPSAPKSKKASPAISPSLDAGSSAPL